MGLVPTLLGFDKTPAHCPCHHRLAAADGVNQLRSRHCGRGGAVRCRPPRDEDFTGDPRRWWPAGGAHASGAVAVQAAWHDQPRVAQTARETHDPAAVVAATFARPQSVQRPRTSSASSIYRPPSAKIPTKADRCGARQFRRRNFRQILFSKRNALAVTSTVAPVSASIAIHNPVIPSTVVTRNTAFRPNAMVTF